MHLNTLLLLDDLLAEDRGKIGTKAKPCCSLAPCVMCLIFKGSLTCRSTLGNRSLSSDSYIPDFTAVALNSAPFRMLRIRRSAFRAALEATQLSGVVGYQVRTLCLHNEHDSYVCLGP